MCVFFFAKSLVSSAREPREANDSDDNFMGIELKRNFHIRQETQFFSCCLIHAISSRSNVDREGLILEEIFFSQHEYFFWQTTKGRKLEYRYRQQVALLGSLLWWESSQYTKSKILYLLLIQASKLCACDLFGVSLNSRLIVQVSPLSLRCHTQHIYLYRLNR